MTPEAARVQGRGALLRDIAAVVLRRGWVALLCVLPLPAVVWAYSAHQPKVYKASIIVEGQDTGYGVPVGGDLLPDPSDVRYLLAYSRTLPVATMTARRVARARGRITGLSADLDFRTEWITLSATAGTPRAAVLGANAFFSSLKDYATTTAAQELRRSIATTRRRLATTTDPTRHAQAADTLNKLLVLREQPGGPVHLVQAPEAFAIAPDPGRNARLAAVLALLAMPALMLLLERLDQRVRRPRDLESLCGTPLLATLPGHLPAEDGVAFERLRDTLTFVGGEHPTDVIAVVGPLEGTDTTAVAAGLARSFAQAGRRVALVDADLRAGGVATELALPEGPGLADVLRGGDLGAALRPVAGAAGALSVLTAGAAEEEPAALLGSPRMSWVLAELCGDHDVVVLATPPVLASSDALALLRAASGVVAVARLKRTSRHAARRMTDIARASGGHLVGVVATGVRRPRAGAPAHA